MVVGAAYFLNLFRRAFFGPLRQEGVVTAMDLRPRELGLLAVFALIVLGVGLWPAPLLEIIRPAAEAWVLRVSP
jgi:NADH-quinone oxidoreductase subunit M